MNTSSNNKVLVGIILAILMVGGAGAAMIFKGDFASTPPVQPSGPTPPPLSGERFEIRGTDLFAINGRKEEKLFFNVKNVTEVKRGPDGATIHFKVAQNERGARCANLESRVTPAEADYQNPPPSKAPWDYERIAHYATIEGCGNSGAASGYLRQNNLFAYLEKKSPNEFFLHIEESSSGKDHTIALPEQTTSELLEIAVFRESRSESGARGYEGYTAIGIPSKTGSLFYYPHESTVSDTKAVVAFAGMIIAADYSANTIIGSLNLEKEGYSVVADSFWFEVKDNSPLFAIGSGWEGACGIGALLDISGSSMKITNVSKINHPNPCLFRSPIITWDDKGLTFNAYREVDLTNQVSKKDMDFFGNAESPSQELEKRNKEIEDRFTATKRYLEVKCYLPPGISASGCSALVKGATYRLTPGGELKRI